MKLKSSQINIAVLVCFCAVLISATLFFADRSNASNVISDFSYRDEQGKKSHLYAITDRPVVLHFWASWCIPCRTELPRLIRHSKQTPDTIYLLISADQKPQDMHAFLKPYMADLGQNIVIINDIDGRITAGHFNIDQFPETIILNKDKYLQQHFIGPVNW